MVRRLISPAILIGVALFIVMGVYEQMNAAARSCSTAGGRWVNENTIQWVWDPMGACEL